MHASVTLLYFAWLREKVGVGQEQYALPDGVRSVAGLVGALRQRGPAFAAAFESTGVIRAAVNQVFAKPDDAVAPGDEIAFFPPVTGG